MALLLVAGCSQGGEPRAVQVVISIDDQVTGPDGSSARANLETITSIGYWYKQESDQGRVVGNETGQMLLISLEEPLGEEPFRFILDPLLSDEEDLPVLLHLVGFNDQGTPLGYWHGALPLGARDQEQEQELSLQAWDPECDLDGDYFPDCRRPQCCPLLKSEHQLASSLGDCIDSEEFVLEHATLFRGDALGVARAAHPFLPGDLETLDEFLCRDGLDNNCDGQDGPCQDQADGGGGEDGGTSDHPEQISDYVRVRGLSLEPAEITLTQGDRFTITPTFTPAKPTDNRITWASSHPEILHIEKYTGAMTALQAGKAQVSGVTMDGGHQAKVSVTVLSAPDSLTLSETELNLSIGQTHLLVATVGPPDAADRRLTLSSSNPEVATVEQDGTVEALAAGNAVILVETLRGNMKAKCVVTVIPISGDGTGENPFQSHPPMGSCLEYKQAHGEALDGHYLLHRNNGEWKVWCDMTTDGGGYTYFKVMLPRRTTFSASEAENRCKTMDMRLFIPRTPGHIASAWTVATRDDIGPDGSDRYLYIMGIYPKWRGARCRYRSLASTTEGCDWEAGDGGPFYVSDRTDIKEPSGDNGPGCSMKYEFNRDGTIYKYNDEPCPGYKSSRFICAPGDKK